MGFVFRVAVTLHVHKLALLTRKQKAPDCLHEESTQGGRQPGLTL